MNTTSAIKSCALILNSPKSSDLDGGTESLKNEIEIWKKLKKNPCLHIIAAYVILIKAAVFANAVNEHVHVLSKVLA
jgi:hypothetical protein